ncbi:MAG TPA: FAD-binding oxidoreductase [Candidatus Paceibacterota bacterium]|nr:FAD-binding oxidoreductase [Candidatus Paceibacterota bacterium]
MSDYETRKHRLSEQMRHASGVRLGKQTSNLFRKRAESQEHHLSVRDFNHVLSVNITEGWADVEGMTTYEDFANETLKYGLMPAVVPQLKTITIGGAVAGVGIEATSFRYGLVHETVLEMEILLATGETVICNKDQRPDLFYGFPNSYGTLGYALRLKVMLIPVKPFVKIHHTRYSDAESYFKALEKVCADAAPDFVDGTMFSPEEMYITTGTFTAEAPFVSDYTYMDIYYKSIKSGRDDYLSVHDYLWRWDTDWFWCSKSFGAQNPVIRKFFGKKRLNSASYWKMRNFAQTHPLLLKLTSPFSQRETIIQDVDIPVDNAPAFQKFFFHEINIRPVWICPFRSYRKNVKFPFYSFDPEKLYVNFGFWDSVSTEKEEGHYNRLIEKKVSALEGKKGLYSDSFYTEEEFWKIYDKKAYDALKQKYDPQDKLKGLYEKCVKRR